MSAGKVSAACTQRLALVSCVSVHRGGKMVAVEIKKKNAKIPTRKEVYSHGNFVMKDEKDGVL